MSGKRKPGAPARRPKPASKSRRKGGRENGQNATVGSSRHSESANAAGPRQAWRSLSRRWKLLLGAFAAFATLLSNWQAVNEVIVQPVVGHFEDQQPGRDERILAELRAGILFSEFQRILNTDSVSVLYDDIEIPSNASGPIRDEFLMLPTAYVEAFVDQNEIVVAYTVTARGDELPAVKTPLGTVHLGRTSVKDAPNRGTGVQDVAFVCGAHIEAYYEVTGTNLVNHAQTYAYGYTGAGGRPEGYKGPTCPPGSSDLSPIPPVAPQSSDSGYYMIGMYSATEEFLRQAVSYRSGLVVNAVTVTAPSVPVVPQMISLHPETVTSLDPLSDVY